MAGVRCLSLHKRSEVGTSILDLNVLASKPGENPVQSCTSLRYCGALDWVKRGFLVGSI